MVFVAATSVIDRSVWYVLSISKLYLIVGRPIILWFLSLLRLFYEAKSFADYIADTEETKAD